LLQPAENSIHVLIAIFFCKNFFVFRFLCNFALCLAAEAVGHNTHYWGAWAFALAEIIPVEPDTDNADAGTRFSFHLFNIYVLMVKRKLLIILNSHG